jgi:hypothetical protein
VAKDGEYRGCEGLDWDLAAAEGWAVGVGGGVFGAAVGNFTSYAVVGGDSDEAVR